MKIKRLKDKQVAKILNETERMYWPAKAYKTLMNLEYKQLV